MNDSDRTEFARTVSAVAELKGREFSLDALDEYFRLLRGLTLQQFQLAFRDVAARSKYFPDPSEVIEAAPPLITRDEPDQVTRCSRCQDHGYVLAERTTDRDTITCTEPCTCPAGTRYARRMREWEQEVKAKNRREQQREPRDWQQGGADFELEPFK